MWRSLVTLIAFAGGMLIARLAETRLIKPLSAIAHHVQTAHAADPTDEVPGMGSEAEIGAIAHALAQARESERLAQLSPREPPPAEESHRRREQTEARAAPHGEPHLDSQYTPTDNGLQ